MCGIAGIVDFSGSANASEVVRRMTQTMTHRGPDDEGYFGNDILAVGMRRLSIIDIAGGHQPMFNDDQSIGVVLNGEIYNFLELREQLIDRGHQFRTRSDSEVVVHAYQEWGNRCVDHLQGMFAFAIWDARSAQFRVSSSKFQVKERDHHRGTTDTAEAQRRNGGTLFLARDRMGIKPLYYVVQRPESQIPNSKFQIPISNDQSSTSAVEDLSVAKRHWTLEVGPWTSFAFASEVRALLASNLVPRQLSQSAVESYLLFGSVSEPMTLIDGVFSLPPAHTLTIDLDAGEPSIQIERYWNIAATPSRNGNASKTEAPQHVRELLEQSVRKHLIADVPVGVFLSSGIDSTSLAALASREVAGVHTFTVAFPETEFSEAAIARRTADTFKTTHTEVMLSGDEMLNQLDTAVAALDLPTMDGINTYFVSQSARAAGLKVALSGLGGDEVFGGYSSFQRAPKFQRLAQASSVVPSGIRSAMASAMASAGGRFMPGDAARKFAAIWKDSEVLPDAYYFARILFTPEQTEGLLRGGGDGNSLWRDWLSTSAQHAKALDSFGAVSCLEAESYLVNTLLRDTDSMSMAHSLEVRVPFLDHPLVEYVTHLPAEQKLSSGTPKALLVKALADLLPSEVVNQPKRGFTLPWQTWLRGPLKRKVEAGLAELAPALSEVLDEQRVRSVWQDYLNGETSWSRPWSLYVLNEWVKRHI